MPRSPSPRRPGGSAPGHLLFPRPSPVQLPDDSRLMLAFQLFPELPNSDFFIK